MTRHYGLLQTSDVRGFGLLEAIVALAILAGSGMALFAWLQQSTETAVRLRRVDAEARLMLTAEALVETVNPMVQRDGRLQVMSIDVQWRAELIEPARQNATFGGAGSGPWAVGLYRVTVDATDSESQVQTRFTQLRVGTRRLTAPEAGL